MMKRIPVQAGDRFGRYVVIREVDSQDKRRRVECLCDCGTKKVVVFQKIRNGSTKSCGCYGGHRYQATHGKTGSFEYRVWENMRKRCTNPSGPKFKNYGARGINVCEEWNSFERFLSDMGEAPSRFHSIDRIDNDKGYSPRNCRWATMKEQNRNRRDNKRLTIEGVTMTLAEWVEKVSGNYGTINSRLHRGWSPAEAVYGRKS